MIISTVYIKHEKLLCNNITVRNYVCLHLLSKFTNLIGKTICMLVLKKFHSAVV